MASLTPLPMAEAVMIRIRAPGRVPLLIEHTTEEALVLASRLIAAAEKSLSMEADFIARFQRANARRRIAGGQP